MQEALVSLALGSSKAGLAAALKASLVGDDGSLTATKNQAGGFTELGSGNYQWVRDDLLADGWRGTVCFHTAAITDLASLRAAGVCLAAVAWEPDAAGGGLTTAAIADAVWDEAQSEHTLAGTFGLYLDAKVSTRAEAVAAGSGAYTLTVTVNDGSTALQGAIVRYTEGVNSFTATTNASGVCTFSLDAATYSVAITKDGYSFTPATHAVSATTAITYSMSAVAITPASTPSQSNAYLTTRDGNGAAQAGVTLAFKLVNTASGTAGHSYTRDEFTATSDADGLLQVVLLRGATYEGRRGDYPPVTFIVTDTSTYQLPEVLGQDA